MLWQKHKVEKFEAEGKKKVGVMQNGDMPLKKKKKPVASRRNPGEEQRKDADEQRDTESRKEIGLGKDGKSSSIDYRFTPCLESFRCAHCGKEIHPEGAGSQHRNHCPHCLYSLHVDEEPGDRKATCHGQMEPIGVISKGDGDWSILHLCKSCGKLSLNRALADDNPLLLMQLAVKPLSSPPFPMSFLSHFLEEKGK
ncbi:DNA-directed RNA polymerase subunit RPC12/RpoP [Oribacterium sinus]|uniref:DNA-directed RNA polymerase subunit RPC12/RpoP n=2 Tax=Oribacterium sinus TaxID=237576 RepID=A0A7W9SIX2_9FIRM|nr:DNA-directed RNA polymerase subunit RPC12/RpoP [Oribacterium sinus]